MVKGTKKSPHKAVKKQEHGKMSPIKGEQKSAPGKRKSGKGKHGVAMPFPH